jgi:glycerophosphoryl diester phosphodiesterase
MSRPARPLVIAHRGASGYRPENTMPAYELAIEQAADMIEVDLHRTVDGAVVVTHDEELAGIGGEGAIVAATFDEVRALDAGDGERVPTLDELLDGFGSRIPLNLELKRPRHGTYDGLCALAWDGVVSREIENQTLFSSFFDPVLQELRGLSPAVRIGLLISRRFPDGWLDRARAVGAEALNPEVALVDAELVDRAHGEGLAVYVYTVDAPDVMSRLLDLGVDGLFTNVPDQMRRVLHTR